MDELRELALAANEEVKMQNRMLDGLEAKMDIVHEKVSNVNEQLKTTLDQVRVKKSWKILICSQFFLLNRHESLTRFVW